MSEHQGQYANSTGRWFENDIASRLLSHGYTERTNAMLLQPGLGLDRPYFVRGARGQCRSIYGLPLKVDFYAWHPQKYLDGLIIEAKHQEKNGSVDEKFPYLLANMLATKIPAILVLLCPGAKPAALRWCLDQQDGSNLRVFTSWDAFVYSCNHGLL